MLKKEVMSHLLPARLREFHPVIRLRNAIYISHECITPGIYPAVLQ